MATSFTSLTDLAIIIIAGAIGGFIAVRWKLPSIVGYIFAGVIISLILQLLGTQHNFNSDFVTQVAQLGIAFLLFASGIEFSINNIKKIRNLVIVGTVAQAALVILFGSIVMRFFGLSQFEAFFVGVIASTSSTAFVLKMLEQREELSTKSSNIMIGWLITQDILVIGLFLLLKTFAPNQGSSTVNIFEPVLKSVFLIGTTLALGKFIIPRVFKFIAETRSQEILLVSVVALSIGFALLTEVFGVSYTLGAFLTGLALSETFLQHEIFSEIKPLRDLFSMVFFVSIGTFLNVSSIWSEIPALVAILFLLLTSKVIIIFVINLFFNIHPKNAMKVALGISQIGEFAFLCISIGKAQNWIGDNVYSLVLIATIVSMTLTPFLYSYADEFYNFVQNKVRDRSPNLYRRFFLKHLTTESKSEFVNHIIICGYGKVGRYVAAALQMAKEDFVVIEVDNKLAEEAQLQGHNIIFGDATNQDILLKAGIKDAKAIVVALSESNTLSLERFVKEIRKLNDGITIILRTSTTLTEVEDVTSIVEPEFEAAVRIVNKLEGLINENKYGLIKKVRNLRRREIKEIIEAENALT